MMFISVTYYVCISTYFSLILPFREDVEISVQCPLMFNCNYSSTLLSHVRGLRHRRQCSIWEASSQLGRRTCKSQAIFLPAKTIITRYINKPLTSTLAFLLQSDSCHLMFKAVFCRPLICSVART